MVMGIKYDYYEKRGQEFVERTSGADLSALYRPFLKYIPEGGHILDAGCGSGRDSKYFITAGCKVTAFDNSMKMVDYASQFIRQKVLCMNFDDVQWERGFDGIWACASLLHVSKENIENILEKFLRALKISGVIFMSFKDGTGERIEPDTGRFFNYYTVEELKLLLKRLPNLEILDAWQTNSPLQQNREQIWTNALARKRT